jgi:hypothetical protein
VDQIAVSGVDFDHVKTGGGAFSRYRERILQGFDLFNRQFVGLGVGIARLGATGRRPSAVSGMALCPLRVDRCCPFVLRVRAGCRRARLGNP